MDEELKKAMEFHGHLCPGLVIGYRVSKYVREHYPRSEDEELVLHRREQLLQCRCRTGPAGMHIWKRQPGFQR